MQIGKVYKLKVNNDIDREPYYMIIKLFSGDYLLIWDRAFRENKAWISYKKEKVEAYIESGSWEIIETECDFKLGSD